MNLINLLKNNNNTSSITSMIAVRYEDPFKDFNYQTAYGIVLGWAVLYLAMWVYIGKRIK